MNDLNNKSFEEFRKEKKIINGDIVWIPKGSKQKTDSLSILSKVFPNKKITLECWYLSKYNDFAFNIIYHGYKNIVRYDKEIHPKDWVDPCTQVPITEPHKHYYKEDCPNEQYRKIIKDDEINSKEVIQALKQFFIELNIEHNGEVNPPQRIRTTRLNDFTEKSDISDKSYDLIDCLSLN